MWLHTAKLKTFYFKYYYSKKFEFKFYWRFWKVLSTPFVSLLSDFSLHSRVALVLDVGEVDVMNPEVDAQRYGLDPSLKHLQTNRDQKQDKRLEKTEPQNAH